VSAKKTGFGSYSLRYLALGLLMKGPGHGYQLDQTLEEVFSLIWKAGQTKLYLTLSSLEKEGLLRIETEPQPNRPDRKVYHLTAQGKQAFQEWVAEPVHSLRAARVELLAKLRFYSWLDLPGSGAFIQAQISVFQTIIEEWQADQGLEPDPFLGQVYEFRIRQARFLVNWLQDFPVTVFKK
jgi:PadR family transcriptional regulator, regulatory protein AphA